MVKKHCQVDNNESIITRVPLDTTPLGWYAFRTTQKLLSTEIFQTVLKRISSGFHAKSSFRRRTLWRTSTGTSTGIWLALPGFKREAVSVTSPTLVHSIICTRYTRGMRQREQYSLVQVIHVNDTGTTTAPVAPALKSHANMACTASR